MSRRQRYALYAAIGCVTAIVRFALRARGPDDYDSFSFVLGMRDDWNLSLFQPQFPGYPVYVVLGRALIRAGIPALAAATGIAAVSSGVTAIALARVAEALGGLRAAIVTAAVYFVAWLPFLLGAGMLSEPPAAALATVALALLVVDRPLGAGLCGGLLLGTRASYWPLVLSFAVFARAGWRRHLVGLGAGILLWAPAFVAHFGLHPLWALGWTHLHGHFESWGNTIVTRPSLPLRLLRLGRDLFYDGAIPNGWVLAAVAVATAIALARHRPRLGSPRAWALLLLPYALWAFFAQNILTQPRHVLPLVLGLVLFLGLTLSTEPALAAIAVGMMALVSFPLARMRHLLPAAPVQAATWAAEKWHGDAGWTAVFAVRSERFFVEQARALSEPWVVHNRAWLNDVYVDLARLDRFPRHILITDEVDLRSGLPAGAPLPRMPGRIVAGPRFCRDERIDRAVPCLSVYELDWRLQ